MDKMTWIKMQFQNLNFKLKMVVKNKTTNKTTVAQKSMNYLLSILYT